MKVFYHNDPDGQAAAAVVTYFEQKRFSRRSIELIPVNFDKPFPYDKIRKEERIYIVDYRPDSWDELMKHTTNVVWIDHHVSSINTFNIWEHPKKYLVERYIFLEHSGCVLVWNYFSKKPTPYFLQLVEDRDIWKWELPETKEFCDGLSIEETNPQTNDNIWSVLLSCGWNRALELIREICKHGEIINKFKVQRNQGICPREMYVRTWEGLTCAVVNRARGMGSETFEDSINPKKFDVLVITSYLGDQWQVSLYSQTINVAELAKKNDPNGGGHKGAAGLRFTKENFPFY